MHFVARTPIDAPRAELYAWHKRPGAFVRLSPPGVRVRIVEQQGDIGDGDRKVLAIGPFGVRWVALHDRHVEGHGFRDRQVRGPFRRWEHVHRFEDDGDARSVLVDEVECELPLGRIGALLGGHFVERRLAALFAHRHRVTRHDVELAAREPAGSRRLGIGGRDVPDARPRAVWAALSSLGWPARWTSGHCPIESAEMRVAVQRDVVVLEDGARRETVPLPDLEDASLAGLHRALRRFTAADR